jgi:endogenous inhibitor of DNA gyrase (YacG/DUF329 family)
MAEERNAKVAVLKTRCPVCRKPAVLEFRPFCSKHCADVDLGRWLGGDYRIPTHDAPDKPDDEKA